MNTVKYKNAPISEMVCGIMFNRAVNNTVIIELVQELKKNYQFISTQPASFEETLQQGGIFQNINYQQSGFCLYRLTDNENYFVSIQQNLILLHWVRGDDKVVGKYPGFQTIYLKFNEIYDSFQNIILSQEPNLNIDKIIGNYFLNYVDRFEYQFGTKVSDLFNLDIEKVFLSNDDDQLVFSVKSAKKIEAINGFSIIEIGTVRDHNEILLVSCSNKLSGKFPDKDSWFSTARNTQVEFFESIFTKEIKSKWQ